MKQWASTDAARCLQEPTASDDKYSRGVLALRTGSDAYPGAAVLGVEGAWRTGIGMVRYAGPRYPARLVLARRPETVVGSGRAHAWVIGSGTVAGDRAVEEADALRELVDGASPVIVDAGAIDLAVHATADLVVTPHDREHARLRELIGLPAAGDRVAAAIETADALSCVVLLKGATTVVAAPGEAPILVEAATSWLATAGTGDVLAGCVGAVVAAASARGEVVSLAALAEFAATGAWIHSHAAVRAVAAHEGGPITALDLAEALPLAVAEVLAQRG